MKTRVLWAGLLLIVVTLFFWKILFTRQFSVFTDHDNANQASASNHFAASEIQRGHLPLWAPYVQGGRSFIGEMQTALFYPLKLILYLWPLGRDGIISLRIQHVMFVFAHALGAWFMFLLCRELALSAFASFVAALCFSLGGFTGRVGWPNILDSAVWAPSIFLCLLRALAAADVRRRVGWAAIAGLALGMAILAGSLHVALMDTVLVASATLFHTRRDWRKGLVIIAIIGSVAFAAGA